jgi:hypothetical protein
MVSAEVACFDTIGALPETGYLGGLVAGSLSGLDFAKWHQVILGSAGVAGRFQNLCYRLLDFPSFSPRTAGRTISGWAA